MRATSSDAAALSALVERARGGDPDALDGLVRALQDDVYRLALRMTAYHEDAEDAAQEILVKVVTRIATFRGEASVRTWAYRIAVRHVLDRKKSRVEVLALDFDAFGADLLDGLTSDRDPDVLLAEEVKRGCTLAMLTCLDREHRLAYVLADVFDLSNAEGAELCEVSEEVYRQRVSRARRALEAFTRSYCGLINPEAPCLCSRRVARAVELGRVYRDRRTRDATVVNETETAVRDVETLHETARLLRQHPTYRAPERILDAVVRSAVIRRTPPRTRLQ